MKVTTTEVVVKPEVIIPAVIEKKVVLELSHEDAERLFALFANISGSDAHGLDICLPRNTMRGSASVGVGAGSGQIKVDMSKARTQLIDPLYDALYKAL